MSFLPFFITIMYNEKDVSMLLVIDVIKQTTPILYHRKASLSLFRKMVESTSRMTGIIRSVHLTIHLDHFYEFMKHYENE